MIYLSDFMIWTIGGGGGSRTW